MSMNHSDILDSIERVKSDTCNFGHQVNSDTHLQTVEIQKPSHQEFHCLLSLFFIPIIQI